VKFVELDFPDMPAAVAAHRVDAAWIVEPFLSQARSRGARVVAWNLVDAAPDLTIATYFTTDKMMQSQPDLVSRFKAAMDQSLHYAQGHPDEVRKVLLTYTKIPPPVAQQITLPKFPTQVNRSSLQTLSRLAQQDGLVKKPVDLDALLDSGS